MKANIFRVAQGANCQLFPVFPYAGPGDIVVACSARRSRGGEDLGSFQHENTVDEVLIGFGGVGRIRTGAVSVGPRLHGVGGVTGAEDDSFTVNSITQRQCEAGAQTEAILFPCRQCGAALFRHDFDGSPELEDASLQVLPTVCGSAEGARLFNSDFSLRTCAQCGCVNDPFPIEHWGWDQHVARAQVAVDARSALQKAIDGE